MTKQRNRFVYISKNLKELIKIAVEDGIKNINRGKITRINPYTWRWRK